MKKQILKWSLIVIAIILLILPIVFFVKEEQKEKDYSALLGTIEKSTSKYAKAYVEPASTFQIKLGELKEKSLITLNLINPKTGAHLSNETYIVANYANGKYTYDIHLYDIPKKDNKLDLIMSFVGDKNLQNGISARYEELGINVSDGVNVLSYSTQYFDKDEEVRTINSSRPKTYTVVYTTLNKKGEIAKITRTVVVQ